MKNYRLKKEAVPFVNEKYATCILSFDKWDEKGIDANALEEVKAPFISHGIKTSDSSTSLSAWSPDDGQKLHLTIHFPSIRFKEHDSFTKGRAVNDLIRRLENTANDYMLNFLDDAR